MKEIHNKDDTVPGEPLDMKQKILCASTAMMGKFTPLNEICDHVVGFHFYNGD